MSDEKIEIPIEDEDLPTSTNENEEIEESNEESEQPSSDKYIEMLKRLQAEFDNYRKRNQKEKAELSTFAKSQLIYNLLPILDDFHHMFNAESTENNDGVAMIFQKLMSVLENEGLKEVEAKGRCFNPQFHEAIIIEHTEDGEDDHVAEEIQKGYMFNEQLLRPARVKVLKRTS